MSTRKSMPCLEGQPHKWDGPAPESAYDESRRCVRCDEWACDRFQNCGLLCYDLENKVDHANALDERLVSRWPTYKEWKEAPGRVTYEYTQSKGTCDWCREKHRREDVRHELTITRQYEEYRYWAAVERRRDERDARQKAKEMEWRIAREQRLETARQRALLRQGRQTLTAIRKHLRGPVSSRPQESRPERTSPTS